MDHVESVPNSPYPPLEVPCLSEHPYDQLEFNTYPARQGWDETKLFEGDFSQHPPESTAAFLQNWLFFGVLWEVFNYIGYGEQNHYVQPHPGTAHGITTITHLDEHMLQLSNYINSTIQSGDMETARDAGLRIEACLTVVSKFCRMATCANDTRSTFKTVWPLSPEVDLSVRALSQRLAWGFSTLLYNGIFSAAPGSLQFPCAYFPLARMREANGKWCPSEIAVVEETFTSASAFYASQLERPPTPPSLPPRDHSRCVRELCLARQLDEKTYRTAHVTMDCSCGPPLGPDIKKITSIIEAGGVPLISIVVTEEEPYFTIDVEPYKTGKHYIAFSHVWSDGLGNPTDNTLPQCQVRRLRELLDELASGMRTRDLVNRLAFGTLWTKFNSSRGASLRFWMDTLCIPVAPEYRELRSKAIKSMKEVYERAYRVVVLEGELQMCPISGYTETFMRIHLSSWMRRLWTLNEGVLALRLVVRFADGFFDVQDAVKERTVRSSTPTARLEEIRNTYGMPSTDADNFHWRFRLLRLNVSSNTDPRLVTRTQTDIVDPVQKRCFAIMEAFSAALYRSTSKESDEMLCFASLIGWDKSLLKGIPFEDQMHALLSTESHLPQGMLFLPGPRMQQDGWRWAVRRFGRTGAARLVAKFDDMTPGRVTARGFEVGYPAIVLPADCTVEQLGTFVVSVKLEGDMVAVFSISRHNENLSEGERSPVEGLVTTRPRQLYVLFWDMFKLSLATPGPAAVISADSNEVPGENWSPEEDPVYRFEFLAYFEVVQRAPRENIQGHIDGEAQVVQRKWTIG